MPRAQAGVAAAVASTSRQLGQTLGVAVVGAVLAAGVGASSYRDTFVSAARPGWWILAACGLAVLVLGAVTNGRWAHRTAERTAERLESPEARGGSPLGHVTPSPYARAAPTPRLAAHPHAAPPHAPRSAPHTHAPPPPHAPGARGTARPAPHAPAADARPRPPGPALTP
ncbi:hypothetical protein LV779_28835 [Streptomyces thinghirensis]|nr:hypothetical protein [Streptomyces thinghirensis]